MTSQITPAGLGFLAIYNPSLSPGSNEDSVDDQIVYFATPSTLSARRRRAQRRRRRKRGAAQHQRVRPTEGVSQAERDERLRQIGLAQGMVEFAGGFAGREAVDVVETERSRVLLREVEPGWWILSSVDLTRVPLPPKLPTASSSSSSPAARPEEVVEYSSRELKPAGLLMQDLIRAHTLFLLHHGVSLSSLLGRLGRRRFVSALARYWDLFLSTWSVCMHGNPIRSVFGGINVAASGELGVGVGEEERGSGEREVLEGLVGRIDGLVDVVVSKFAEANEGEDSEREKGPPGAGGGGPPSWLGTGRDPEVEDGTIFLGVGALSKTSLRDLAHWVEDLYTWGGNAYGVIGAPSYVHEDTKGKKPAPKGSDGEAEPPRASDLAADNAHQAQEGPVGGVKSADNGAVGTVVERPPADLPGGEPTQPSPPGETANPPGETLSQHGEEGHMDRFVSILTLGYGTYWSLGGDGEAPSDTSATPAGRDAKDKSVQERPVDESEGYFLIGLKGTVEEHAFSDSEEDSPAESPSPPSTHTRILHVRLSSSGAAEVQGGSDHQDDDQTDPATPLRAVVYVIKPFIFTFLFRPDTPALASDALYRSLHYQLSPLRKPLLLSTSYRPSRPGGSVTGSSSSTAAPSVYDLIFDPATNTTHSTIPNIPAGAPNPWTRSEAAATHSHLLSLYAARKPRDVEATVRTNKGWWIVWSRVSPAPAHDMPPAIAEEDESSDGEAPGGGGGGGGSTAAPRGQAKEVFLLRRAGDSRARAFSGSGLMGDGPAKLGQGIGVDTRGYIEGLLSLGR